MLESVRAVLSLQEFLLCALALTSNKMQSMIKVDATNFSYILKHWWKNSSSSSNRLKIIIRKMKTIDDQISYLSLTDEMSKLLYLRSRLSKSQTLSSMKYAHSSWVTRLILNSTFRWDDSMIWYHNDTNKKRQSYWKFASTSQKSIDRIDSQQISNHQRVINRLKRIIISDSRGQFKV